MIKTDKNIHLLEKLAPLCEGTPWELTFHCRDNDSWIRVHISIRSDEPRFTPQIYLHESPWSDDNELDFKVQTTSYGALSYFEIKQVADKLQEAVRLIQTLGDAATALGYKVRLG